MTRRTDARAATARAAQRILLSTSSRDGARAVRLLQAAPLPARIRSGATRRLAQFAMASGAAAFLDGMIDRLAGGDHDARGLAHSLAVTIGNLDRAEAIAATPGPPSWSTPENQRSLLATRLLAGGDADAVVTLVEQADTPEVGHHMIDQYVRALVATGRPHRAHAVAAQASDPILAATARFDASWQLGDAAAARDAVADAVTRPGVNSELVSRYRASCRAIGVDDEQVRQELDDAARRRPEQTDLDARLSLQLLFGRTDLVLAELAVPGTVSRLRPRGRLAGAICHYVHRDFDAARTLLRSLLGTVHHWDAEKLGARIDLELGDPAGAVANRTTRSRLRPALDEVEYLARLQLGHHATAFASYLLRHDAERARRTFGDRTETFPAGRVERRFVVAQDGPGDEIAMAATYPQLEQISGHVTATCDPRLAPLLRRSFPEITFVPTRRQPSRPALGFLAEDEPPRAIGNLYDLLSAEAARRAETADRVVFGRSLARLTPGVAPYEAYLLPDPGLVAELSERFGPAPAVGVVWRSEFVDPMRSIHFVTPAMLQPLARPQARFVCLQHDADADERAELRRVLGEHVLFPDDLNLRDDFEVAAAAVAACTAVIGVGTTITELAGAVGTPTMFLHPNLMGAWRRQPGDHDYWHRSVHTAVTDDPSRPERCVVRAAELLDLQLDAPA